MNVIRPVSTALLVFAAAWISQATPKYTNFEGSPVNPIRLSADLTRLYVINNPNCSLSVFDVTTPTNPVKIVEIPVGIEPVSVAPNPYSTVLNDEVWVVNQESDSISVVSVSKGIVTDTIAAKDEPADIVFANGAAFVSISRSNLINVYNATTHALVRSIPVFGGLPKALALSPDGTAVYAAFRASGNQTTSIPCRAEVVERPDWTDRHGGRLIVVRGMPRVGIGHREVHGRQDDQSARQATADSGQAYAAQTSDEQTHPGKREMQRRGWRHVALERVREQRADPGKSRHGQ